MDTTIINAVTYAPYIGLPVAVIALMFGHRERKVLLGALSVGQALLITVTLLIGTVIDTKNEENLIIYVGVHFLVGCASIIVSIASIATAICKDSVQ